MKDIDDIIVKINKKSGVYTKNMKSYIKVKKMQLHM